MCSTKAYCMPNSGSQRRCLLLAAIAGAVRGQRDLITRNIRPYRLARVQRKVDSCKSCMCVRVGGEGASAASYVMRVAH